MRINDIEFRYCETNKLWELIQWFVNDNGKEYCIVLSFYRKYKEGYNMETVGNRFHKALEDDQDAVIAVSSFGMSYLTNIFDIEEKLKEFDY